MKKDKKKLTASEAGRLGAAATNKKYKGKKQSEWCRKAALARWGKNNKKKK
ncbi:MAG: hypothetical protein KGI27_12990 [Thaumarchaeota archaeon]|nr:hypothetical protein [Nitrososphaerota archaeon]